MPEQEQQHHKESLVDKIFHHGHHKDGEQAGSAGQNNDQSVPKQSEAKKLEGEFKNYMKEDEKLSQEGKEYGGLM